MTTRLMFKERLRAHFLAHQLLWSSGLLVVWMLVNATILATTELMEAGREGRELAVWEPFCWELSSIAIIVLAVWPIAQFHRWLQGRISGGALGWLVLAHALMTLPFSLVHVVAMVGIREVVYAWMGFYYDFGHWGYEFLYEYRKDAMTYATILIVVSCYQFIVRRLHGEASCIDESDTSTAPLADRLLVKKLGKEFLISIADIDWVEASGNYANLHVRDSIYPMRITMTKLEALLPQTCFCRVHRSAIVNVNQVVSMQPQDSGDYKIDLRTGVEVPLSRRYRDDFKALSALAVG